jgi:hypothetical protein
MVTHTGTHAKALTAAYAHSDIEQARPLLGALDLGFKAVEVDVWAAGPVLLASHDFGKIRPNVRLKNTYLQPAWQRLQSAGPLRSDGAPVWLFVDFKTPPGRTYAALRRELLRWPGLLGKPTPRGPTPAAMHVVLTGWRPSVETIEAERDRLVVLDGRLGDLGRVTNPELMPVVSDDWSKTFAWRGEGAMPKGERDRLESYASEARRHGQSLRFWATPDRAGVERDRIWGTLLEAGIGMINTDDLQGLAAFLSAEGVTDRQD